MGFGPEAPGLEFEEIYDGSSDAPVSFPWGFESPLPFTLDGSLYFSPILKNALDELYCYVIDRGTVFYRYNITRKHWTKLASLNYTAENGYRSPAISPDGTMIACVSEGGASGAQRLEIYTIATDTWVATAQAGNIMTGGQQAILRPPVWETNDKIWCWATKPGQLSGQCVSYVISTTTWRGAVKSSPTLWTATGSGTQTPATTARATSRYRTTAPTWPPFRRTPSASGPFTIWGFTA